MPVKFKLGFTIDAKTLFGIMSQFLPVKDLVVEEIVEREPELVNRFDKQFDLPKPKRAPQVRAKKGSGYKLSVHTGANGVIMEALSDGAEHPGSDCFPAMRAAGYATNGIYGKFKRLERHGILSSHKGKWRLTQQGKELWEQRPAPRDTAA
jgi:hypothetical protein